TNQISFETHESAWMDTPAPANHACSRPNHPILYHKAKTALFIIFLHLVLVPSSRTNHSRNNTYPAIKTTDDNYLVDKIKD
ncbi:MAG: hypothetical protein ACTSU9_05860, partial [Promethearchaeota archaeon]